MGYQKERDDVKVYLVPFAALTQEVEITPESSNFLDEWRYIIIMIMALLIVYFGIIRPFVSSITDSMKQDRDMRDAEKRRLIDSADGVEDLDRLELLARDFTTADKNELSNLVERFEQPSAEVLRRWIRSE